MCCAELQKDRGCLATRGSIGRDTASLLPFAFTTTIVPSQLEEIHTCQDIFLLLVLLVQANAYVHVHRTCSKDWPAMDVVQAFNSLV